MVDVTAFFAGLFGLMLVALSVNVIMDRYRLRLALGDGGNEITRRKIRAQGNFAEYVPMALFLMALCELGGVAPAWLYVMGYGLLLGRVSHAYGLLIAEPKQSKILFRQIGMVATFTVITILSLLALTA